MDMSDMIPQKDQDSNDKQADDVFLERSHFPGMAMNGVQMPSSAKVTRSVSMRPGMYPKPRVELRIRASDDGENHPLIQTHAFNGIHASGSDKPGMPLKLRYGTGRKTEVLGQTNASVVNARVNAQVNAPVGRPTRFRQLDVTPPLFPEMNMQGTSTYQWPLHSMASHLAGGFAQVAPLSPAVASHPDWAVQINDIARKILSCLLLKPQENTAFEAKLSWFPAVNALWFWLVKVGCFSDMLELMGELTKTLDGFAETLLPITEPAGFGSIVLAAFHGHFYRAVILNADREKGFVFFIDYGNQAEVLWCDMRVIPKDKVSALTLGTGLPMIATRCKPKSIDYGYQFNSPDDEKMVMAMLLTAMEEATRFTGTVWKVGKHACEVDVAVHPAFALDVLLEQRGKIPFDKLSFKSRSGKHMVLLEPKMVRIVGLVSASEMYCWPGDPEMTKYLIEALSKELLRRFAPGCILEVTIPEAGDPVAVLMGNRAARGRVLEHHGYDMQCSVELVDYGQVVKVPYVSLHPLHPGDLEVPPLALRCYIPGVQQYDKANQGTELATKILKVGDKLEYLVNFFTWIRRRKARERESVVKSTFC